MGLVEKEKCGEGGKEESICSKEFCDVFQRLFVIIIL